MKTLKKIARITSLVLVVFAGIVLFSIAYLMFFKFSNNSAITPDKNIKSVVSIYPKNIISDVSYSFLWGEKAKEIRTLISELDSLNKDSYPDLSIDPTKPIFFFTDNWSNQLIEGEIFSINKKSTFEKNIASDFPKAFWIMKDNTVCILKSETLSKDDLKKYYSSKNWSEKKMNGNEVINITWHSENKEQVTAKLSYHKNRLLIDAVLLTKEVYNFPKSDTKYNIELGTDLNGKPNPILGLFSNSLLALKHNYKGLYVDVKDSKPIIRPVGESHFVFTEIDSSALQFKHLDLKEVKNTDSNLTSWSLNENKHEVSSGKPLHIALTGSQLLKFEGNTMIIGVASMSSIVGDLMEIISNMDEIKIEGTMLNGKKMKIKGNITYNSSSDLLSDILLYLGYNKSKIIDFSNTANSKNK